ncbi:MAG: helix-hairpin-helix domain-containing protein [Saprospiraceae bacterium]|nr:helix-hairpin-helix domain-containing protein [Saprospiraceae bacterium]
MKIYCLLLFLLFSTQLYNQVISDQLFDQIENFIEEQDLEVDVINLYERLQILSESPIDLNKADADDLTELRLLSNIQVYALIDHIAEFGKLISIEELQSIPSFNIEDINRLRPFVKVNSNDQFQMSIPNMIFNSRNEFSLKWARILQTKKGFIPDENGETKYIGDQNRFLARYRNNFENRLRFGFTFEKDPGEKLIPEGSKGFDYMSFFMYLKDYNRTLKDLAIGDFSVSLGQGLIAHNGFGAGKGALVTQIIRGGRVIRPYSSVFENGYLRGIGTTVRINENIEITVFGSRVNRDGNVQTDTLDTSEQELAFTGLQTSGNHRTEGEIEDRKKVSNTTFGGALKYKARKGHISLNMMSNQFGLTVLSDDKLYNKYRFSGTAFTNVSLDYNYRYRNFNFFGESATAVNNGSAHMFGAMIGLHKNVSLALHFRNYSKGYVALLPNAFAESSSINNENGIYIGMEWQISQKWKFRTYADFWKHPWLKFGISRPSNGQEYYLRLDYYLKRKLLAYIQYTNEEKLRDYIVDGFATTQTGNQRKQRIRLHFTNQLTKGIELRTRAEYVLFKNEIKQSRGFLLYQDIIFKSIASPLSFTSRIAFFDTDDFDSRVFAYENSVLYEFAIPSYFDQGFRYYLNLRYKTRQNLTIELRYAKTHLTNRDSFSSGNEFIDGDSRSEIKIQTRYVF